MNKWILLISILAGGELIIWHYTFAAPSKTTTTPKDSEFNDPFLEIEAETEKQQEELEKKEFKARGEIPLEENIIPEAEVIKKKDDSSSVKLQDSVSTEVPSKGSALTNTESLGAVPSIQNSERQSVPQENQRATGERWTLRDPAKGYVGRDDEGAYYYDEDQQSGVREVMGNPQIVPHQSNYARGLLRVSTDGSYIYKPEESEREGSLSVRMSQMPPLAIENKYGITFEDIYGSGSIPIVFIDYDWLAIRRFGHWVLSVGTGFGQVDGPGRFIDDFQEANEIYTFYVLLNHISFIYRFQYSEHPWFVPYVSAGGIPGILYELRDDNKRTKSQLVTAAQVSGGVRLNVGKADPYGVSTLDSEYGINNMWLDIELKRIQNIGDKIDISNNLINAGIGFDF